MTRDEILQTFDDINFVYNDCTRYDTLKRMLEELTERKRGKWIDQVVEDELLAQKCSVCGYLEYVYGRPNYCPNCGARMDERREDAEAVNTKN